MHGKQGGSGLRLPLPHAEGAVGFTALPLCAVCVPQFNYCIGQFVLQLTTSSW